MEPMKYNIDVTLTPVSRLSTTDFNNIPFGATFSDHMFMADYENGEWKNMQILPFGYIPLHPANLAIHYGQSIFEGMKVNKMHDGTPALFRTDMHIDRINKSAERMCMPTFPGDLFDQALNMLVEIDHQWIPTSEGASLYVRPFMFATDETIGVKASSNYKFMIITGPVGLYFSKPVKLWVEEHYVRAANGGVGEAKTAGNYAASLLPAKLAREKGYDQVIWMDSKEFKYIQEVGTMNLFFVIDGKIITPVTDGAILKGITRDSFLHLLRDRGYEVEERLLTIDEVIAAHKAGTLTEAFGAGTAAVVSPIIEITKEDYTMKLPPLEGNKIAPLCKELITGIKAGKVADKHGWLQPIHINKYQKI
jgi:branched-chain amino acid aminotransferase